jgi:hypothetical protein
LALAHLDHGLADSRFDFVAAIFVGTNGGVGRFDIDVRFPALEFGVGHAAVKHLYAEVALAEIGHLDLGLGVEPN